MKFNTISDILLYMKATYIQHKNKILDSSKKFNHIMAIALDPRAHYREGVVRCITRRKGSVSILGYIDKSALYKIKISKLGNFQIKEKLYIRNQSKIIQQLGDNCDFLGLEDADIWIDDENLMHLYFTIPFIGENKNFITHLGHAVGKNLDSLEMTKPVIIATKEIGVKELSVAEINSQNFRYNLVEASEIEPDFTYSVIRVVSAKNMGKEWKLGDIIFHPKKKRIPWIAGHASPGPLFSKNFINLGEGKSLGLINGREANKIIDGKIKYGIFSVGLFIYDYENGKIDWVSPNTYIKDSEAATITFASQLVETRKGEAIVYAHVDDSFIRAYTLKAKLIKPLLPKYLINT